MNLLIDTHILLWWLANDRCIAREAYDWISDSRNDVYVSAASVWEISINAALVKLRAPDDLEGAIERNNFRSLPISIAHAARAGALPRHHNGPFDHMLVAQALPERLTLVTADRRLHAYGDVVRFV